MRRPRASGAGPACGMDGESLLDAIMTAIADSLGHTRGDPEARQRLLRGLLSRHSGVIDVLDVRDHLAR